MIISSINGQVCFQPEYRPIVGLAGDVIAIKCIDYNLIPLNKLLLLLKQSTASDLLVLIHVDFLIAQQIAMQPNIKALLYSMLNLRLVVSENFPNLDDGRDNPLIEELCKCAPLWFWGLGSDGSSMVAVMNRLFEGIIIDGNFYSEYKHRLIFDVMINIVKKYAEYIIVDENNRLYQIK
ncbi:hypothetical protein SJI19_06260 [Acerihabitans sp. TG2]|uniref:hypothetical protein n=1 Tax=Acerihabitans sp. TG2 TaxID=3096008 RepID=UPI002B228AA9|nr:hypothetical protein [Acerihabitans sp. TG2]MEA9390157.1 hypothetical protein [Acerihabitans sp. TG2]